MAGGIQESREKASMNPNLNLHTIAVLAKKISMNFSDTVFRVS